MVENKNAKTPADDGKPVAWQLLGLAHFRRKIPAGSPARYWDPLYAAPPKREWVGLTDEERHNIREWQEIQKELGPVWAPMMLYLYLAIEQALKEKNHG